MKPELPPASSARRCCPASPMRRKTWRNWSRRLRTPAPNTSSLILCSFNLVPRLFSCPFLKSSFLTWPRVISSAFRNALSCLLRIENAFLSSWRDCGKNIAFTITTTAMPSVPTQQLSHPDRCNCSDPSYNQCFAHAIGSPQKRLFSGLPIRVPGTLVRQRDVVSNSLCHRHLARHEGGHSLRLA